MLGSRLVSLVGEQLRGTNQVGGGVDVSQGSFDVDQGVVRHKEEVVPEICDSESQMNSSKTSSTLESCFLGAIQRSRNREVVVEASI